MTGPDGTALPKATQDDYVMGLLLALIVFAAIPVTSGAATWLAALLLLIVWTPVITGKASLKHGYANLSGGPNNSSGVFSA